MIFYSSILSLALLHLPSATARSFTVVNTCTYTIWYAPICLVFLSRRIPRRSDLSLAVIQACSKCIPAIPAFHVSQTQFYFQIYTDLSAGNSVPQFPTGRVSNIFSFWQFPLMYIYRWESPPSTSAQFSVPDNWKSGRIWVRIFPPPQLLGRRCLAVFSL